jgi:hypothetical protein
VVAGKLAAAGKARLRAIGGRSGRERPAYRIRRARARRNSAALTAASRLRRLARPATAGLVSGFAVVVVLTPRFSCLFPLHETGEAEFECSQFEILSEETVPQESDPYHRSRLQFLGASGRKRTKLLAAI